MAAGTIGEECRHCTRMADRWTEAKRDGRTVLVPVCGAWPCVNKAQGTTRK